jgi:hypothetical protein
MNFKSLSIVFALFVVAMCIFVAPVSAENKYVPITPEPVLDGQLYVTLGCHHNLITKDFTVQRVASTNLFFVNGARVQKDFVDKLTPLGDNQTVPFGHDGLYDGSWADGIYVVSIADGDGGQPEYAVVKITKGYRFDVNFIGHGVSMGDGTAKADVYEILRATYGKQSCSQVVDVEAHKEYRFKKYVWSSWSSWSVNKPSGHNACEESKNVAATYKTVCVGSTIDVTQNVRSVVVDQGIRTFVFDNSKNPGGIFDVSKNNLLSMINDPAVGIVKTVTITYNKNGVATTLVTDEYEVINL